MKFHRYWVRETGKLQVGNNEWRMVRSHGGSDVSEADARANARHKLEVLARRIAGDPDAFADYDPAIREEIVDTLDAANVITRTRNGTLVLNSENTFFIDIDQPPPRFWKSLFAWRRLSLKERIVADLRDVALRYPENGIRLYETHNGVRAILTGTAQLAGDEDTDAILADFNADPLYARLCAKQRCFRARLTPKPARAGCRPLRVAFPRDEVEQAELDAWLPEYSAKSAGYAVCRFIEDIGPVQRTRIIDYHDRATGALSNLKLA